MLTPMSINEWWPRLRPETREELIASVEKPLTPKLLAEITEAGGVVTSDAWWVGIDSGPSGLYLSGEAVDWIEDIAFEEDRAEP